MVEVVLVILKPWFVASTKVVAVPPSIVALISVSRPSLSRSAMAPSRNPEEDKLITVYHVFCTGLA